MRVRRVSRHFACVFPAMLAWFSTAMHVAHMHNELSRCHIPWSLDKDQPLRSYYWSFCGDFAGIKLCVHLMARVVISQPHLYRYLNGVNTEASIDKVEDWRYRDRICTLAGIGQRDGESIISSNHNSVGAKPSIR